jgi:hypothetical protein
MSLHLFFSDMKFQTNMLTQTPVRTVFVAAARNWVTQPCPQVHIFGTKINQFPNEILNVFALKFGRYEVSGHLQKTEIEFHCIK